MMRSVRFRTLGCYPLTGAVESDADTLPAIIQEMLLAHDLGAPGPRDRPRLAARRWRRRSRRATSDGRTSRDLIAARHRRATSSAHQHKSLLRFITCGSVDDGKSTLIGRLLYDSKIAVRGPARGARGRLEEGRHAGRRARLRAAGRRPRGRARAGHHHRRRLPLLRHRQAQVHRRRHARPRAVHAQHGHRRLDRRPRGDPDRRAQGRADADPAAQLPRLAARHPPRRARGQQDGPGRLLAARCSTRIEARLPRVRRASSASTTIVCIPISALQGRQHHRRRARTRPGITGPTLIEHLETVEVDDDRAGRPVPHAGAVGQPAEPRLPRLLRARSLGGTRAARRRACACCRRASDEHGRAHRHAWTAISTRRSPASRSR